MFRKFKIDTMNQYFDKLNKEVLASNIKGTTLQVQIESIIAVLKKESATMPDQEKFFYYDLYEALRFRWSKRVQTENLKGKILVPYPKNIEDNF